MTTQPSPAYLAFLEVKNALVSGQRISRVVHGAEKFLCFSDPSDLRPMATAVRMAARAEHAPLSDSEFDLALRQAEARVAVVPRAQAAFAF